MAVVYDLRLVSLVVLMLASHLDALVVVYGLRGTDLPGDVLGNKPDPYVKMWCADSHLETDYYQGNNNPSWSSRYTLANCTTGDTLHLELWDKDVVFDDRLGSTSGTVGKDTYHGSFSVGEGQMYYSYDVK